MTGQDQRAAEPCPYGPRLLRPELDAYLSDAVPAVQSLLTCCPPWTVRDMTIHLLCTFSRFHRMLIQGRAGDFSAPFPMDRLAAENERAVRGYRGTDPASELRAAVEGFSAALDDGAELIPHQRGPIPVARQVGYGINELAVHHSDVAVAAGHGYVPAPETLAVLQSLWRRPGHDVTSWAGILRASGRNT